jgi:predicted nucleic acid-binding protein
MAISPVLADSSYYIQLLREGRDPLRELAVAAATRDLATCGVIQCEVGRGVRHDHVRSRFCAAWELMVNVPTDIRLWTEVEQTAWELDRMGTTLPLTDIVIACCARRIGALVLTFDRHFLAIPNLRVSDRLEL